MSISKTKSKTLTIDIQQVEFRKPSGSIVQMLAPRLSACATSRAPSATTRPSTREGRRHVQRIARAQVGHLLDSRINRSPRFDNGGRVRERTRLWRRRRRDTKPGRCRRESWKIQLRRAKRILYDHCIQHRDGSDQRDSDRGRSSDRLHGDRDQWTVVGV